jgi:hypothetical protein
LCGLVLLLFLLELCFLLELRSCFVHFFTNLFFKFFSFVFFVGMLECYCYSSLPSLLLGIDGCSISLLFINC